MDIQKYAFQNYFFLNVVWHVTNQLRSANTGETKCFYCLASFSYDFVSVFVFFIRKIPKQKKTTNRL